MERCLTRKAYANKGTILSVLPEELLEYTYWSNTSGLEDPSENYSKITCRPTEEREGTKLAIVIQDDSATEGAMKHLEWGWKTISNSMKNFLEKQ
jgi:hypothetical protein